MSELHCHQIGAEQRFVAEQDGTRVGLIDYRTDGSVVDITHTETDPARQGQGIADALTRFAVEQAQRQGWSIRPTCPYTRAWLGRHPEFADLVAD